tara:strand:- start:155 stop:535 length:381 start_codon:yes stop_codon:yes gene_type:complete
LSNAFEFGWSFLKGSLTKFETGASYVPHLHNDDGKYRPDTADGREGNGQRPPSIKMPRPSVPTGDENRPYNEPQRQAEEDTAYRDRLRENFDNEQLASEANVRGWEKRNTARPTMPMPITHRNDRS